MMKLTSKVIFDKEDEDKRVMLFCIAVLFTAAIQKKHSALLFKTVLYTKYTVNTVVKYRGVEQSGSSSGS